jgi:hypothetical protein
LRMIPRDTSAKVFNEQIERLRRMTGEQRLRIARDLTEMTRRLMLTRLRTEHPDWGTEELRREMRRILYPELAARMASR